MILSEDGDWNLPKLLEELNGCLILLAEVLLVSLLVKITKKEVICFDCVFLVSINPKDQIYPMVQIQGHVLALQDLSHSEYELILIRSPFGEIDIMHNIFILPRS